MTAPKDCDRCPALVKCRKTVVNGWGNPDARFAFVGQNPGESEDAQGRPFIGRAGRVLATMIRSADINVDDVFLTNAVRCLTPAIRKPRKDEWSACREFLLEELGRVKPDVIVALGEVAAHTLYGRTSLDSVLGQTLVQEELGIQLIVTYHPAFVLRGQWNAVPLILSHFEKAKRIVAGTQTLGELGDYAPILTIENLKLLRDYLLSAPLIHLDSETTGKEWKDDELLCISFATEPGEGYVVPILQRGGGRFWADTEQAEAMMIIGEILASPVPKALQGGAFDIRFFERERSYHITARTAFGWRLFNLQQDTMLMHRLTHEYLPKESTPNELPHLLSSYSDMPVYGDEVRKQSKNKLHMDEVENRYLWELAAADADAVARLVPILGQQLDEDGDSRWIYENVSIPMVRCCQEMTRRGMLVDQDYFTSLCEHYEQKARELEKQAFEIAGREFNPNSTKQVQDVLFRELALPKSGRKTGAATECDACEKGACEKHDQVSEDALLDIKGQVDHPILDVLMEIRSVSKLRGTYLAGTGGDSQGFLGHIRRDGRIHPEFKGGFAETGRAASQNPNAQNIPKGVEIEELGTKNAFRRTFIAPPGHVLMEADWSQAEVWVTAYGLAEQFGDRTLLEILESGRDVHCVTPETRILTADLLWKEAGQIVVGEKILGFDEDRAKGKTRHYRAATIVAANRQKARVYELRLSDGTRLRSTGDHRWLVKTRGKVDRDTRMYAWVRTDELAQRCKSPWKKRGPVLPRYFQPWESGQDYDSGFLAGAFDGEGSLSGYAGRYRARLAFVQNDNALLRDVEIVLKQKGHTYGRHERSTSTSPRTGLPTGNTVVQLELNNGFAGTLRFLGEMRPPRLLEKWQEMFEKDEFLEMRAIDQVVVEEVIDLGEQTIMALQSNCQTYFAEGFGAHNTAVGRAIWPVDLELDEFEWAKEHDDLRTDAKVFTFGITFGLTVEGIMERLHCSKEDAQRYLVAYLEMAPGLRDYKDYVQNTILAGEPLTNKFGRQWHFPQVEVMKLCNARFDLEELFREGVNRGIQGGASDLHSLAHVDTESNPKMREVFRIIDAVHDSCLAEVPAPDLATVLETAWMVKHLWQEIALNTVLADGSKLGWQIPVEVSWGRNWGDMPYVLTARGGLLYKGQPVQTDMTAALPIA